MEMDTSTSGDTVLQPLRVACYCTTDTMTTNTQLQDDGVERTSWCLSHYSITTTTMAMTMMMIKLTRTTMVYKYFL
jgi:hypothetical protein